MPEAPEIQARCTILVADDDQLIRSLARDALESEGFTVLEATGGAEAVESFERERPALLLLDVTMADLDGYAVCSEIRSRHPDDFTPIVIVTAKADPPSIDRAYEVGATDFVSKPINWALLGHRLRYLLRASRALGAVKQSERSLANAQRIAHVGSWEWSPADDRMTWSDETFRILGFAPASIEANPRNLIGCAHPDDRERLRKQLNQAIQQGKSFDLEHRLLLTGGELRSVYQQIEVSSDGVLMGTIQNITERKQSEEHIRYLANYDSLTGLANRRLFVERLSMLTSRAKERGCALALLYLDLDRFKRINDTLGHSAGDLLLRRVADVLRKHVRGSDVVARVDPENFDDENASISRLGGDEFTIILSEMAAPEDAGDVARRILDALPNPLSIEGHEISTTCSIGIAIYPHDGNDVETLVRHADTAMYQAKQHGRNSFQFFCPSMNAASTRKLQIEERLRGALERRELKLHYQPKLDLRSGEVCGMEALLRWHDDELGIVSPKDVIPVAEETGLIHRLGAQMLEKACRQNAEWQRLGYRRVPVAVNISSAQFSRPDLCQTISNALRSAKLDPRWLEIEITESVLLQDEEGNARTLREIKAMGIRIALDDFGTGYTALSYLTRIPFDTLKLDRSFIRDMEADPRSIGIIISVIAMAHSLGARVVAEGVDAEEQETFLRSHGCDELQGFLFSASVPPETFGRFLGSPDGAAK